MLLPFLVGVGLHDVDPPLRSTDPSFSPKSTSPNAAKIKPFGVWTVPRTQDGRLSGGRRRKLCAGGEN